MPEGFSTTSVVGGAGGGAGLASGAFASVAGAGALSVLGACAITPLELTIAAPIETTTTANRLLTSNGLRFIFPDPENNDFEIRGRLPAALGGPRHSSVHT